MWWQVGDMWKMRAEDRNQTKHAVTWPPLFIFSPPSNTLSLPLPLSPAQSAWLILMGRPLFVYVPSCVHHCGLSIIAGLWGSFSIWRHIWHSAASINVVIILIFMSLGFTPFLSSPTPPLPPHPHHWFFDSSNCLSSILQIFDNLSSER